MDLANSRVATERLAEEFNPGLARRSAVNEAVIRDLEGAGLLSHPNVDRQAIIDGLLRGDADDPHVQNYRALQHYVNPDTELKGHEDAPFGVPPEQIRTAAQRGFQGRGWSTDEMAGLNRDVQSRELSPGSRQAQEWERRRNLTEGLLDEKRPRSFMTKLGEAVTYPFSETPEAAFQRTRDAKLGESGWGGAMENPEYAFGDYLTRYGQPIGDYLQYQFHEGMSADEADKTAQMRSRAAKMSNTLATKIPSHMDTSTPEAKERSYKAVKGIYEGFKPMSYDNQKRQATGQYPDYGTSSLYSFMYNSGDPSLVVPIAHGLGAARAAGGLKMAAKQAPQIVGRGLVKDGLIDEIPNQAAISGLFGVFDSVPKQFLTAGNEARTDLYNPATGKPETEAEFVNKITRLRKARGQSQSDFKTYEDYGHPLMTR